MKSKKIISVFLMLLTLFTMCTLSASALTWDGSSAGGSTNAVNGSSKGYVIRDTNDSNCVVGYRFSVVNSSGGMKVTKVMDVYRNTTNGNHAYSTSAKFSTKYNKKQMIANKNAKLTTTSNTTNCYKEKDMSFLTALPNPSGIETWQAYETNINKVLTKIGIGTTANMIYGDKVIIEPLFDICLAGEYQALTVSEIAYCGRSVKGGSSDGGTSNGTSSTWGFIANYTNRIWPNKLYTPNGQGLWTAASKIADGTKETFENILTKGYGAGIAYNETANITYTIKFDGNGSTSGSTASMSMVKDVAKNLTANGFKKTGNKFVSWNTKADGSGTKYTDKQSVKNLATKQDAIITLYAQWSPYTLTVAYDCYGSSVTVSDTSKGFSLGEYNRITTTTGNNKTIGGTKNVYYQTFKYNSELGGKGLHNFGSFGLSAPTGYRFVGWKGGSTVFDDDITTYKPTDFTSDIKTGDTTIWLSAKFSPNTYSVKFNGNGSTSGSMSNQSFTYDTAKALSANAFKREFTVTYNYNGNGSSNTTAKATASFGGWAKSTTGSKAYDNSQSVKNLSSTNGATVNLYAKWTDGNVTLPTPTRTGYSFSGWYTAASGGTKIGSGGAKYTPSANITLYAHWKPNTYTVRYYLDGVEQTSLEQSCAYGTSYKYPSTPTKTGYTVSAWWSGSTLSNKGTQYTAGGSFSNLTSTDKGTVKRYAYSNSKSYTVKYYLDGTEQTTLEQTCSYDTTYKYPELSTKTGYTITGWWSGSTSVSKGTQYAAGSSFSNLTSTNNGTVKRYAYSDPNTYKVKFNGNGSTSGSMSNQSFTYDVAKNLTANAFKREFTVTYNYNGNGKDNTTAKATATFTGWAKSSTGTKAYDNSQNVKNLSSTNGATVNLYAKWTDGSVSLPTPTRTGYSFSGWYTATSGGTKIGDGGAKYTPSANKTLYARWSPIKYSLRFNGNGSTSGSMTDQSFTYDVAQNITANAFRREFTVTYNYNVSGKDNTTDKATAKFNGWAKSATGSKVYDDKQNVKNLSSTNGDIIDVYAKWTDGSVILPESTRTGYTFDGWYTSATSGTKIGDVGSSYTPSKNITLYAHWTPITYTIKFNKNGATGGSTASMSMTYDVAQNLTTNGFTWDNHKWINWNTKADGSGTVYTNKQIVKNLTSVQDKVITLYAQWETLEEEHPLSLEPIKPNADYREGTDVITSFYIVNNGKTDCTPDRNVSVVFTVKDGDTAIRRVTLSDVVVPANNKNLLFFKWTVPNNIGATNVSISGEIVINGKADGYVCDSYKTCKYTISETPDTQYEIGAPDGFSKPSVPANKNNSATWEVWEYENGSFKTVKYGIAISDDNANLTPAASANASKKDGVWIMKSGYGIELSTGNAMKSVSGTVLPNTNSYTTAQYSIASFPEFGYLKTTGNYRTLELVSGKWILRENGSYGRIHFTPLWYPDGSYSVNVTISDCWTPAGMITRTVNTNTVTISGSAYDDWTIS